MPATIVPRILTLRTNYVPPPAPEDPSAMRVIDGRNGSAFVVDLGVDPSHSTSFVREYQIMGDPATYTAFRPIFGAGPTEIRVAGYMTEVGHDLTGSVMIRFRDTIDGVVGDWRAYSSLTITNETLPTMTTIDQWGDGRTTVTLDAAYPVEAVQLAPGEDHGFYFIYDDAPTVESFHPAVRVNPATASDLGPYTKTLNGAAKNPRTSDNFMHDTTISGAGVGPFTSAHIAAGPIPFTHGDIVATAYANLPGEQTDWWIDDVVNAARTESLTFLLSVPSYLPRGLFPPACYSATSFRARTMYHMDLCRVSQIPTAVVPSMNLANRNLFWTRTLQRVAPLFGTGSNQTRGLSPRSHAYAYHRNYFEGEGTSVVCAMNASLSDAEREKFARGAVARMIHRMPHLNERDHFHWWELCPLFVGFLLGITEWTSPERYAIVKSKNYDRYRGSGGEDAVGGEAVNITDGSRWVRYDQLHPTNPGAAQPFNFPAQDSPIVSDITTDGITLDYTPLNATEAANTARLPGWTDNEDGTWTIAPGYAMFGMRTAAGAIGFLNPRPIVTGGFPFNTYNENGTDAEFETKWPAQPTGSLQGMSKTMTYVFQHASRLCWLFLVMHSLGRKNYVVTDNFEIAARDYMAHSANSVDTYADFARRTPGDGTPVWGADPAPGSTDLDGTTNAGWWSAVDAVDGAGGGGVAGNGASAVVPQAQPAQLIGLSDHGDYLRYDISLAGLPRGIGADGGAPIIDWEYRIDGGAPVTVDNSNLGVSVLAEGFPGGTERTVEVRLRNSAGLSEWSRPRYVTPTAAAGQIVERYRYNNSSGTANPTVSLPGGLTDDIALIFGTRNLAGSTINTPAGMTAHAVGVGGAEQRLWCFSKVLASDGDFTQVLTGSTTSTHTWGVTALLIRPTAGPIEIGVQKAGTWAQQASNVTHINLQRLGVDADPDVGVNSLILSAAASEYGGVWEFEDYTNGNTAVPAQRGSWLLAGAGRAYVGVVATIDFDGGTTPQLRYERIPNPDNPPSLIYTYRAASLFSVEIRVAV